MKALPPIDLSRIRDHAGAKDRGFEELAYLLAWDLEDLDRGTEIERRATPDGGIEFSCIPVGKGNGGRWAWQAKYLFKFDASTFAQMTKSVVAALASTPDLERYIFVLPKDRSTAALTKWNDAVAGWTKKAKAKGMTVEFQFRGESQILAAATSDEQAGAIRYSSTRRFSRRSSWPTRSTARSRTSASDTAPTSTSRPRPAASSTPPAGGHGSPRRSRTF